MILLSFDTEEFDVPREHGVDFSLEEGMKVSVEGTNRFSIYCWLTTYMPPSSAQETLLNMLQK